MTNQFVFDTYALIELLEGNPSYTKYSDAMMVINDFIFAEFCYVVIKRYPDNNLAFEEKAESIMGSLSGIQPRQLMKAMKFRHDNRKKDLSTTDCAGYFHALQLGIPFLTGDSQFKGMPGVEFVR